MTKAKYDTLRRNDEIDYLVALGQAASAIDAVGYIAQQKEDSETLLRVALSWIELSDKLRRVEKDEILEDESQGFGFRSENGEG